MQVVERLGSGAHRSGRESSWPEWLGRIGLVGRGLLHVAVGWVAIRLAFGDRSADADQRGALQALAGQPFGRIMLLVLAALFAAYAAYRFALALLDPEDDGLAKRVWYSGRGIFYGVLTWAALSLATGASRGGGSDRERDLTVRVLGMTGGRLIVMAVGFGVIGAGLWFGSRVVTGKFAKDLKHDEMPERVERVVHTIGTVGTLARMVSFALVGTFLVITGWRFDPSSPVGLDESLAKLRDQSWGPAALLAVGTGLVAFGLFAIARARYQRIFDN